MGRKMSRMSRIQRFIRIQHAKYFYFALLKLFCKVYFAIITTGLLLELISNQNNIIVNE